MRRLIAAVTVVGACIFVAGCGSGSQGAKTTTTTPGLIAPPIQERALDGLLLSPEQINAAMGAKEMAVTKNRTSMSDDSATMEPRECLAIDGTAQAQVYEGSGFTAERDLSLQNGDNFTHYAEQAVVLFATVKQAAAFVATAAQQWPNCHEYRHIQSGTQWTVAPVSNSNGVLSTTATEKEAKAPGWGCGRALAARNNVVIDVNTCSANPGDSAVKIANQIAGKIPV